MKFSVYQESNIGSRAVNQDRMGYSFTRDALLLVLADGMGGHLHGEIAANIALQSMATQFQQNALPYIRKPERFLEESFIAAHNEIRRYSGVHKLSESPRTTLAACLIQHNSAYWAHCGDSRVYWVRSGEVLAKTRDHSKIESLIAQGKAQPSERTTHPERNKLFNCLGAEVLPIVEISRRVSLQGGDVILLCSDGLWAPVSDDMLAQKLHTTDIVQAVPELIASAVSYAGKHSDNVTALAMSWGHETTAADEESGYVSTHGMLVGGLQSTINGMVDTQLVSEMDDNAIEKAIEEIRGAIEKNS